MEEVKLMCLVCVISRSGPQLHTGKQLQAGKRGPKWRSQNRYPHHWRQIPGWCHTAGPEPQRRGHWAICHRYERRPLSRLETYLYSFCAAQCVCFKRPGIFHTLDKLKSFTVEWHYALLPIWSNTILSRYTKLCLLFTGSWGWRGITIISQSPTVY